jgi:iron complex transport system ATP-binding protein
MSLVLDNVSCGYTRDPVLLEVSLAVDEGEFVCLLGPNGCGKTALLKTLAGILPPLGGHIRIDGREWSALTVRERAARLAYVPQAHAPLFAFSVIDVVAMGRTARWPLWSGPTAADWRAAETALAAVQMSAFAERRYTSSAAANGRWFSSPGLSRRRRVSSCSTSRRRRWISATRCGCSRRCAALCARVSAC